jgi:hypothetical protein
MSRRRPSEHRGDGLSRTVTLEPIRAALAALPPLTLDLIVRALLNEEGLEVVGCYGSWKALWDALGGRQVDVVIVGGQSEAVMAVQRDLLAARPRTRVLLLDTHHGVAELFELRPRRVHLGAVSPRELARVVRDDAEHRAAWAAASGDTRGGG